MSVMIFASEGVPLPSGDFRTEDMIALGVSLAVALLLCFVVIGFLAYTLRRFKSDWKKLSEASIFQSSVSCINTEQLKFIYIYLLHPFQSYL